MNKGMMALPNKKSETDTNKKVAKKTETDTNKRVTKKTKSDTNKDINKKVETVRRFFSDSKASNHPVKEHPISKTDEYVRNMYFDMLCVAAQYESDDTENAFTLIKRIMSACKNVQPFEEYIRRSMELTVEKTAEFIKQCRDNKLCEIFFVDLLLISCSNGTPNAKQIAFLAQYGDMLGFKKAEMTEISEFAAAILKQDSDGYQKILNKNNAYIQEAVLCYTKEFVSGLLICTSKKRYYFSKKLAKLDEDKIKPNKKWLDEDEEEFVFGISTLNEIKFENLIISDIECLKLKTIKNVIFENCHCMRGPLYLEAIDKISINNCVFKWEGEKNERKGNYDLENESNYNLSRAIEANLNNFELIVNNTSFSGYEVSRYNTSYYNDIYYYSGAVFYNRNEERGDSIIKFDKCDFSDIYTSQRRSGYYGDYAIFYFRNGYYGTNLSVTNCHFSNCRSDHSRNTLFNNIYEERDNVLVNSNPIK